MNLMMSRKVTVNLIPSFPRELNSSSRMNNFLSSIFGSGMTYLTLQHYTFLVLAVDHPQPYPSNINSATPTLDSHDSEAV